MSSGKFTAEAQRRKDVLQCLTFAGKNTYSTHLIAITLWSVLSLTSRTHHLVHR